MISTPDNSSSRSALRISTGPPSPSPAAASGSRVPVVYRVNMRSPDAYFYASGFKLRDKDVVYVANAEGAEASKLLRLVNLATSSAGVGRLVDRID